jgi:UDP-glucose 4-epimerase
MTMRIVVTGATGNVGTALMRVLADDPRMSRITGLARRVPDHAPDRVEWLAADITSAPLREVFEGADAVVHLAWEIQPSHDRARLWRTNVLGSHRVFTAAVAAGVPALIHASSVGVYSPGRSDRPVSEDWPRLGVGSSLYAVHKAETERMLDRIEHGHEGMRVVRMRPALIFSRRAAASIARLFVGPLMPRRLPRASPVLPSLMRLRFQAVHSDDVAQAYRAAIVEKAGGAFNIAADPVIGMDDVARVTGARRVSLPAGLARAATALTWRARLQPTSEGWLDMGLGVPVMDSGRARRELGWEPRHDALAALAELIDGLAEGGSADTPALRAGRRRRTPREDPRTEEAA